jgi:hypothetical protein
MNIQEINALTKASVGQLTSEAYLAEFNDAVTGKQFAEKINALENAPRTATTATRPRGSVRGEEPSATPASSFDPSFDEIPAAPAPAVPAPAPVAETEGEEKVHSYQPVDRNGRPVGGKQVFKYRTDAELIEKLTKAHSASSARIRELSRSRKLDEITDAGVTATKVPRPTDVVPATPEELAKELRAVRESNYALSIRVAANTFLENCPEYATRYRTQANNESLILAIHRANDDETDPEAYMRAFTKMRDVMEPVVAAEPTPVVVAVPAPAPAPVVPAPAPATPAIRPAQRAGISTGLSNADQTSLENPVFEQPIKVVGVKLLIDGKSQMMDFRSWDRLSSDSQKKILRNSANAAAINALYDAENERRAAARSAR